MVIYSKANDEVAINDLEFRLKRSIQLVKENKVAKKNGKKKTERATVSRERRLALALRAVLDATADATTDNETIKVTEEVAVAENEAQQVLDDLGYSSLVGIPKRLKELNEQLKAAVESGDGELIAELGRRMHLVKQGKDPQIKEKAAAAEA